MGMCGAARVDAGPYLRLLCLAWGRLRCRSVLWGTPAGTEGLLLSGLRAPAGTEGLLLSGMEAPAGTEGLHLSGMKAPAEGCAQPCLILVCLAPGRVYQRKGGAGNTCMRWAQQARDFVVAGPMPV